MPRAAATIPKQPDVVLLVALVSTEAAPLLVAVNDHTPVRFVVTLCFFCLGPGAAILALLNPNAQRFELGLVVGLSLSSLTIIAVAMLGAHAWDPEIATYAVAAACLAVLLPKLLASGWRFARAQPDDTEPEPWQYPVASRGPAAREGGRGPATNPGGGGAATLVGDPPGSVRTVSAHGRTMSTTAARLLTVALSRRAISGYLTLAGLGLWITALHHTDLAKISGYGLLSALPVTYYAGLILVAAGFLVAVSESAPAPLLLAAHSVALIFMLHGTTAELYAEPRYTYTYKHLAVIDYITGHGSVNRSIDIYQNWPGFFALNAWFQRAGGVLASSYAAWAQVFFEMFNLAAILFAVRGLTRNVRLQWTTAWFFLVADWVGQNYLAPQAGAFPLYLLVAGLCLRCAPRPRGVQWRLGRRFRGRIARLATPGEPAGSRAGSPDGLLTPRRALFAGAVLFAAMVVSHQLSPVVLLVLVAFFAVATARLPMRIVVAMVAAELAWVAWAWPYLTKHVSLVTVQLALTSRPQGENSGRALPGVTLVANMARLVVVAMALLAVVAALKQRRSGRLQLPPVVFAIAPPAVVPFQPYGEEIRYRAFLFALPWLAYFAAVLCLPSVSSRTVGVVRLWRLAVATGVVGTAFLFAYFGLEKVNHVTSGDVAAVVGYEDHAPSGSLMASAAPGGPDRVNANYARLKFAGDDWVPVLSDMPLLRKRLVTRRDIPAIAEFLGAAPARRTYLSVTPSQANFAQLFGIMPPHAFERLAQVLQHSRKFRLVYRRGPAFVFELQPAGPRR
jgi:hypothetical protein